MNRILGDKDQVTARYSPGFLSDTEPTLTIEYQHQFVVRRLNVNRVASVIENSDVCRNVLPVKKEHAFDGVAGCRLIGRKTFECIS